MNQNRPARFRAPTRELRAPPLQERADRGEGHRSEFTLRFSGVADGPIDTILFISYSCNHNECLFDP